jgi:hypothetical protein
MTAPVVLTSGLTKQFGWSAPSMRVPRPQHARRRPAPEALLAPLAVTAVLVAAAVVVFERRDLR